MRARASASERVAADGTIRFASRPAVAFAVVRTMPCGVWDYCVRARVVRCCCFCCFCRSSPLTDSLNAAAASAVISADRLSLSSSIRVDYGINKRAPDRGHRIFTHSPAPHFIVDSVSRILLPLPSTPLDLLSSGDACGGLRMSTDGTRVVASGAVKSTGDSDRPASDGPTLIAIHLAELLGAMLFTYVGGGAVAVTGAYAVARAHCHCHAMRRAYRRLSGIVCLCVPRSQVWSRMRRSTARAQ
jgi:hypothetical protein